MNLLVTGAWKQAEDYIERLREQHDVIFMQWENKELPCLYEWVEGIIGNGIFLSHPIEKFINLRYIQLTSAGYDRVPMDYVQEHKIEVHNAKGVYSIPMAEFAVAGVLQLYKQSKFFHENQKQHIWEKHRGLLELNNKNICIIGCGDVGDACAKLFKAFGCHVFGINRSKKANDLYEEIYEIGKIRDIVSRMDVIILTIALTKETRHLVNLDILKMLKNTSILVNLARGEIIDTHALVENISNIGGAVLDVFEDEPLPVESVLWDMENVILTPHNSFVGDKNEKRMKNLILKNLES